MPLFSVTEGWTEVLGPFSLAIEGVPFNLTGVTSITLVLRRASGVLAPAGGVVTPLNQSTDPGKLQYAPVATDFVWEENLHTNEQTYKLHWKVVTAGGKVIFFPNGSPAEVSVHRA
jgi:hypothetical protein